MLSSCQENDPNSCRKKLDHILNPINCQGNYPSVNKWDFFQIPSKTFCRGPDFFISLELVSSFFDPVKVSLILINVYKFHDKIHHMNVKYSTLIYCLRLENTFHENNLFNNKTLKNFHKFLRNLSVGRYYIIF